MKMNWKLYDENGSFLQEVNCQYDSLDFAHFEYNAIEVKVDFKNKKSYIIKKGDSNESHD